MQILEIVRKSLLVFFAFIVWSCNEPSQTAFPEVIITGAMRQTMWQNELEAKIELDTLSASPWYGIGPLANLSGELMVENGVVFVSTVTKDGEMLVENHSAVGAPFFVRTSVAEWTEENLPDSIRNMAQVEQYLTHRAGEHKSPFAFRMEGIVEYAQMHVMNVPDNTDIFSPDEAHQHQVNFPLNNRTCRLLGFYSATHQGVFTHHDSKVHIHLITQENDLMGHVDMMQLGKGLKIFLPKQ